MKEESKRLEVDQMASFARLSEDLQILTLNVQSDVGISTDQVIGSRMVLSTEEIVRNLLLLRGDLDCKKRQSIIMSSLSFSSRTNRYEAIPEASAITFQWVLDSILAKWLRQDSQRLFWISGRPGSGKSTLMKFLAAHPSIGGFLKEWAGTSRVIIASHYFWSSGTSDQRSQRGLLRSLLYDVFRHCPDIISTTCPSRWKTALATTDTSPDAWSMAELTSALQSCLACSHLETKFCWFIDGLDEYEGEHDSLCDFLINFTKSPNLKLCVSSRPWNDFKDAFEGRPQLAVHDCTRADIANFARERLQSHKRWASCSADEVEKENLVQSIGDKANGVFLWVFLVTRSLRAGLTNDDDLEELRRRVEATPTELGNLFRHILDSVDQIYHEKMAQTILLALEAEEVPGLKWPFMFDALVHHENESRDSEYAIKSQVGSPTPADLDRLRSRTRRRLNARTKGLVETGGSDIETVVFLHRTVKDFLRTAEMTHYLRSKVAIDFDPALSIVKAYVVIVKSRYFDSADLDWSYGRTAKGYAMLHLPDHLRECFQFGQRISDGRLETLSRLMVELEQSLVTMFESGQARFQRDSHECHAILAFRELLVQSDLFPRVASFLAHGDDYLVKFYESGIPPLFHAAAFGSLSGMKYLCEELGCDPNQSAKGLSEGTPWLGIVWSYYRLRGGVHSSVLVISKFLALGADPNAVHQGRTAFSIFLSTAHYVYASNYERCYISMYLQALDTFIIAGANLNAKDIEDGHPGVLQALDHAINASRHLFAPDEKIIRCIVKKLLSKGMICWDFVSIFEQTVRARFRTNEAREVLELLETFGQGKGTKRKLKDALQD